MPVKSTTVPVLVLNMESDGCHLMIKARVNGKAVRLLIDTGASKTVFDRERLSRLGNQTLQASDKLSSGLGTDSMKSHTTVLKKLELDSLHIRNFQVVILDLSHVNSAYEKLGFKPIDGVLGSDLLLELDACVDYKKKELRLRKHSKHNYHKIRS